MSQPSKLFRLLRKPFKRFQLFDSALNRPNQLAHIPLWLWLTVPFVVQLVGAVGLVGYLSYRSGQQLVASLADHLMEETGSHITDDLNNYLQIPQQINQSNIAALRSGAISLDNLDQLHRYLILQHQHFPEVTTLLFSNPQGDFRLSHHVGSLDIGSNPAQVRPTELPFKAGRPEPTDPSQSSFYTVDAAGNLGRKLTTVNRIDVRQILWYRHAVETGRPGWSTPFQIGKTPVLALSAYTPMYDAAQQLQGVFAVNLSLDRLDEFLTTLSVGKTGQVFILETNGLLLTSSAPEPEYRVLSPDRDESYTPLLVDQPEKPKLLRFAASESPNLLIQNAARQLQRTFGRFEDIKSTQKLTFQINGERHYLQVVPYQGLYELNWLVVIVVPESDFMTEIKANQRQTLGLCVLTCGLALATGALTAHWIAAPIRRLQQAADAIARGQFDTPIEEGGIGEVAQLSDRFRQMAHQLSIFFETAQASEQKFANLLDNLPVGVSVFDATSQLVYVNQVGQQIAGSPLKQEQMISSFDQIAAAYPFYVAGTQDSYPAEQLPVKRGLRGEATTIDDLDVEIDGRRIALEVQTIPIYDDQGQVIYAINVFQDITERRQATQLQANYQRDLEQALAQQATAIRQSEARFQFAVDQMPDVFVLYDAERRFQFVNARGIEISGLSLADYLGKRDEDLHPPQVTDAYLPLLKRAIATRSIQTGECTIALPHRDPFTIIVKYAPLLDRDGNIQQVVALTYDITPRKRAELALQESEARFRQIAATISQVFLIRDAVSGQFLYISPAYETIWGRSCDSLYQNPGSWLEAIYPEDLPYVQQSLQQQFHGQPVMREYRIQRSDGSIRWIQAAISTVRDEQGTVVRYAGIAEDITDRKQFEQALQATTRQLQTFLSNAPVIISLFDMDGRYLQVNPAFAALLGCAEADIVGRTFGDFHPQSVADRFQARLNRILESGLPLDVEDELVLNGEVKTFQTILFPVMNAQGIPTSFWAISTDISDRKQAEEALRQSEARLQLITDSLPGCIAYIDASQRYQFVNRTYEHWFNYRIDEIVGRTVRQVIGAAAYQVVQHYIEQALSGETVAYEHDMPYQSGGRRYVSTVLVPDRDDQNTVRGYYALITDISDRRQAELALQETNARQQAILSVMPDLMYVVAADGRVLGQVTFRPERDLFTIDQAISQMTIFHVGTPEHVNQKVSALQTALATRKMQIYEQRVEKEGETWYEEVRCVPMPGRRVLFMFRDISDRKRAEEELKQSEDRFRKAFDDAPIGMALVAPLTGRFLRVNRELQRILGYSEAELLQLSFHDITHADDLKANLQGRQQMLTGQLRQYQTKKRYIHKQGYVVQVLLSSSLVRDQDDNPLYLVTHVLDMSDRYRIDQMKDEFISIVSHELRTPLTAIRGSLGILESGVLDDDPDEVKSMLKIASNSSERLVRLVNDILDLERLESGKTELVMQVCSVSAVVQDAIEAVSAIAAAANVTLSVAQTETSLYAAPDALVQTLTNLLSNAIKFSDPGSTVWLTAEPFEALPEATSEPRPRLSATATYWLFSVRDRGRGIPADKQEMIFERFQQIDVSDARQKGGTGLGLAICQTIIRQHGGRIWVQSEVGQGSVFYFTVPCWRKDA